METFAKLDCGCYVGFDTNHKPIMGKQCPLHEASKDMYEALKKICVEHSNFVFEELAEAIGNTNTRILKDTIEAGRQALAKANGE